MTEIILLKHQYNKIYEILIFIRFLLVTAALVIVYSVVLDRQQLQAMSLPHPFRELLKQQCQSALILDIALLKYFVVFGSRASSFVTK